MSSFTHPVILKMLGHRKYEVYEEFEFVYYDKTIKIPKGLETDLATIPRLFWVVFPPNGVYAKAAIVHDFLYRQLSDSYKISRKLADEIFLEGMTVLGVARWRRTAIYLAVRVGGFLFYKTR